MVIQIPGGVSITARIHRFFVSHAVGRMLLALIDGISVYIGASGRFWFAFISSAGILGFGLGGLVLRRNKFARLTSTAKAIWDQFAEIGLFSTDIWRPLSVISTIMMSAAFWPVIAKKKLLWILCAKLGALLGASIILVKVVAAAGKRTIESRKPHWFADWTNIGKLNSKDVYMVNLGFEQTVADMFKEMGFRTSHVGVQNAREILGITSSGDSGVDIMAEPPNSRTKRYIISCKRYGHKVGPDEVKILFMDLDKMRSNPVHQGKDLSGMIVTTVGFTSGAIELAGTLNIGLFTMSDLRLEAERSYIL